MLKIKTKSESETKTIGYKLGKLLKNGDILCLTGDLGAGKTTMTSAISKGLNIEDYITSPTFTIVKEYKGRYPLYHFDVYRIEDSEEMYDIGFEEYIYSDGVVIIEWANNIKDILPEDRLEISMRRTETEDERDIDFLPFGNRYNELVDKLRGVV